MKNVNTVERKTVLKVNIVPESKLLAYKVYDSEIIYNYGEKIENFDVNGDKYAEGDLKSSKNSVIMYYSNWYRMNENPISEFGMRYINHISTKLVTLAAKKVYQQSGNKHIFELYQKSGMVQRDWEKLENWTLYLETDETIKGRKTYQKRVQHTYKIVKMGTEKFRKEIKPYVTLEKTKFGKMLDKMPIFEQNNAQDLVEVGKIAIMELISAGLVHDFVDIWNYRKFVLNKITNAIHAEKNEINAKQIHLKTFKAKKQDGTYIDKRLEKVLENETISAFEKAIVSKLDKRTNKEQFITIIDLKYVHGNTNKEIANILKISEKTVEKVITQFKKLLKNPESAKALKSYLLG